MPQRNPVTVNDRTYAWPTSPVVVVCIDGSEPAYMETAIRDGHMPFVEQLSKNGTSLIARCVIPSFTNPNNLSIVTGCPPSIHGISGNFFLDPESGQQVMMNEPRFLRAQTVFQAFHDAGASVTVITAKDKLRRLLGHGLDFTSGRAICFSSEKSDQTTLGENGIEGADRIVGRPVPDVYSADLSEFVFAAGVKLMASKRPDLMYLSTTDYIQHKHAPGDPTANDFYRMMDGYFAELAEMGAVLVLTADHGMNAKHRADGTPDVIYLQSELDTLLGGGSARVILPITDPYVVHHGALGSFATVYLETASNIDMAVGHLDRLAGIDRVLPRADAAQAFELPEDRLGDLVVLSEKGKVLGTRAADHDLSGLTEPLRSHGGITEQNVPLMVNRSLKEANGLNDPRNYDAFDVALNHIEPAPV